jgi:3-dehydrotetronate 4-kinase
MKLGCIADDFTGATDLANNLVRSGMRVMQTFGVPTAPLSSDVDAVVVALKSRTIPASEAIAQSLAALQWLQAQGAVQIYFKYCSTFDSTPAGNIGPVTEALMDALHCKFTIATPAFPDNGRTVFKGYLFAGAVLLNESGMQNHPLTPMTDANLVRVMQAQTQRKVGLIDHTTMAKGTQAITDKIKQLEAEGVGVAIVDATSNEDLKTLGPALKGMALVTAGSGVAIGLPGNWGLQASAKAAALPAPSGFQAIVSGSCSLATQGQVAHYIASGQPSWQFKPLNWTAQDVPAQIKADVAAALAWAEPLLSQGPVLVYATTDADTLQKVQAKFGREQAGEWMESALAQVCQGLQALGVKQWVIAGGETSGACVQALNITQMQIGPQIDPGVPWCFAPQHTAGHLTLKSGNFGTPDFFTKAFKVLAETTT